MKNAPYLALAAAMMVSACGTARSYRLPLAGHEAHKTFSPIAACADQRSMEYSEHPESIHVKTDEVSWVQYMVQNDAYNMVVIVDDKKVAAGEALEAKFTATKKIGDEIYQCAMGHAHAEAPITTGTAPAVAVEVNVGDWTGDCAKLARCYTEVGAALCEAGTECSFEMKVEGNDQAACRELLMTMPAMTAPFAAMKPGFTTPASCL